MSTRKITRRMFFAIKRDLASTNRRISDIAADYPVGSSTVSLVNRTVTWENYLAKRIARSPIRGRAVKPSDPVVRREKAAQAGLKPQDRVDRATKHLSDELQALSKTPTREEFDSSNTVINDRLRLQYNRIRDSEKVINTHGIWLIVLIFVAIAALVIAVVK